MSIVYIHKAAFSFLNKKWRADKYKTYIKNLIALFRQEKKGLTGLTNYA